MKVWQPLTPEQLERAEERLRNPRPGSRIEAAQHYGIDLTLLISNLRLTPEKRFEKMHDVAQSLEELRRTARRVRK